MMTEIICYLDRDRERAYVTCVFSVVMMMMDSGTLDFRFFLFILHSLNKWIHCHMMSNIKCEYERVRFGQSVSNI